VEMCYQLQFPPAASQLEQRINSERAHLKLEMLTFFSGCFRYVCVHRPRIVFISVFIVVHQKMFICIGLLSLVHRQEQDRITNQLFIWHKWKIEKYRFYIGATNSIQVER
jgi:hypothetical protein